MSSLRFLSPALLGALLLSVSSVHAADPPKGAAPKGKSLLLSRSELRECMAMQDRIKDKREEMLKAKAQLTQEKDDLARRGDELKEQLVWVDRTSKEQVDKYNALTTERDKQIDTYQARSNAFNAQVDTLNAERDTWSRNCENKRFDEADEIAIKKEKKS